MNRSNFALFVALLIHLLLILTFWVLGSILPEIEKTEPSEEKRIKISLKELPKAIKKAAPKKKIIPEVKTVVEVPKIAPPMPKGSQLKKIIKKAPVKYKPKLKPKTPKLNPKPIKKVKVKVKTLEKARVKVKKVQEKKKEVDAPMNWLYEDKAKFEEPQIKIQDSRGPSAGRNIKELYGSKFGELSAAQQEYILDNQEIMRRITQQILTRQASVSNLRGLNVNKTNVIEFYLHPNGDMSDFKFLHKSGYFLLDEITRVTIEYAYSKYPRPKEKTLIRYNVFYNLTSY